MADGLIFFKGVTNVALAALMITRPELAYDQNPVSHWIHSAFGYKIANPLKDPGFTQGVAFLVGVIGVGYLVASRSGPAAQPTAFAIVAATAALAVGSSTLQKESGMACTMTFTMAVTETLSTIALYALGAARGSTPIPKKHD